MKEKLNDVKVVRSLPLGYEYMYLEDDWYVKARKEIEKSGMLYFGTVRDQDLKYADLLRLKNFKQDWQKERFRCRVKREKVLSCLVGKRIGDLPYSIRWSCEVLYRCGIVEFVI